MIPRTITRVLDYYLNPENAVFWGTEVERACQEFGDGKPIDFDDLEVAGHLSEWFLFDYKLKNDKTPLQYFYDNNPLRLSADELSVYKDIQENEFGLFEIEAVAMNKGMRLRSLRSDRQYEVKEKQATHNVRKTEVYIGRVMKVDDHYELTGGSSFCLPPFDEGAKQYISETNDILNPKILYKVFIKGLARNQNLKAEAIGDDLTVISGNNDGSEFEEYDGCPVCELMKKAKAEGRKPTEKELMKAMKEANQRGGK